MWKIIKAVILTIWFIVALVFAYYIAISNNDILQPLLPALLFQIVIPVIFIISDDDLVNMVLWNGSDDNE